MTVELSSTDGGVILSVKAQPGGRANAIRGEHAGSLRVSVTQAPEKGKANAAITEVLCEGLGLRRGQIALVAGETQAKKKFLVREITAEELRIRIERALAATE